MKSAPAPAVYVQIDEARSDGQPLGVNDAGTIRSDKRRSDLTDAARFHQHIGGLKNALGHEHPAADNEQWWDRGWGVRYSMHPFTG